jgi:hypothetical protein
LYFSAVAGVDITESDRPGALRAEAILMDAINQIIDSYGYESAEAMDLGDSIEVDVDGFMELVIEKCGEKHLSVAHYYEQRGDLMRDPEVVFSLGDGEWTPFEFRQDPMFHQHDEDGLDIEEFLTQWNSNIQNQGFVDAAQANVEADREEQ